MRVMLVAPPWYTVPPGAYGGTELVVALLAQELHRRGHVVTVVASDGSTCAGRLRRPASPPPDPSLLGDAWIEARHVVAAYRDLDDVDIVHDHSGVIGAALAAICRDRPPVVHTLHGPWTPEARAFYPLVDDRIHLVAISGAQRTDNPDVRWADTVHNGIDLDAFPPGTGERGEELVYIGRANAGKNPAGAIRVARAAGRPLTMIVKRHEAAEREHWRRQVEPLLGSDVEVLEDVPHHQKLAVVQRAHAMVFPIRWPEPFGLVMIEAMASGTPVLASPAGAAPEVIDDGRTGFLCASEEQMARAVSRVGELDRDDCRRWVAERFSAAAMTDRYEALYRTLLGASPACGGRTDGCALAGHVHEAAEHRAEQRVRDGV